MSLHKDSVSSQLLWFGGELLSSPQFMYCNLTPMQQCPHFLGFDLINRLLLLFYVCFQKGLLSLLLREDIILISFSVPLPSAV